MPSAPGNRARFKKGQKVLFPEPYTTEDGDFDHLWHAGQITRGEKYTDPETNQIIFYYDVLIPNLNKGIESRYQEDELYKYNADLIHGVFSPEADDIRAYARAATEAKRMMERHTIIPPQLRLTIPPSLKQLVLDDYDLIMHQGKILPLPRPAHSKPSVAQLIRDWQVFRKLDEEEELCVQIDEISDKLIEYFDLSLRQYLLFQPEVTACDLALSSLGEAPSQIYGAEHLVRLIVKLPELVPVVLMSSPGNAQFIITVEDEIGDLLAWATDETRQEILLSTKEDYIINPHWTPPPVIAPTALTTPGAKKGGKGGAQENENGEEKAMEEDAEDAAAAVGVDAE
jgi:MRG